MNRYELKTDPIAFDLSFEGLKNYEIRLNDRDYKKGDVLLLKETHYTGEEMQNEFPLIFTGRSIECVVTNVLTAYGVQEGWCILSIDILKREGHHA